MIGFLAFISEQVDEICTSFERYLVLVAVPFNRCSLCFNIEIQRYAFDCPGQLRFYEIYATLLNVKVVHGMFSASFESINISNGLHS